MTRPPALVERLTRGGATALGLLAASGWALLAQVLM